MDLINVLVSFESRTRVKWQAVRLETFEGQNTSSINTRFLRKSRSRKSGGLNVLAFLSSQIWNKSLEDIGQV